MSATTAGYSATSGGEDPRRRRAHVTAPVRIGTCSFADEALTKWWYPKGVPAKERLAYYAERFDTVEIDSTYYRLPERDDDRRLGGADT